MVFILKIFLIVEFFFATSNTVVVVVVVVLRQRIQRYRNPCLITWSLSYLTEGDEGSIVKHILLLSFIKYLSLLFCNFTNTPANHLVGWCKPSENFIQAYNIHSFALLLAKQMSYYDREQICYWLLSTLYNYYLQNDFSSSPFPTKQTNHFSPKSFLTFLSLVPSRNHLFVCPLTGSSNIIIIGYSCSKSY